MQVMLHHVKHNIAINVEIAVGNVVADANDITPWDFGSFLKQYPVCPFGYLADAFTDGLNEHTTGGQKFHAFWRAVVVISVLYVLVPFLQLKYSILDLLEHGAHMLIV